MTKPPPSRHPFSVHDLWAAERLSDPCHLGATDQIVVTRSRADLEQNRMVSDLWLVGASGGPLRRLTGHAAGSSEPQVAPDGRTVYFVSQRGDRRQVWRIAVDGGEAEQVTDLAVDVEGFQLSPDGENLVVAAEVFPDLITPAATAERLVERDKELASGRLFDRLPVRHWDRWKDGRRSHLFAVPVDGGEPIAVTPHLDADTPTRPFGRMNGEVTFTPDGAAVVFTAHDRGREMAWTTDASLFVAALDGTGERRCLTADNAAWCTQPCFSPDGTTLAYLAMQRPGFEADRFRVVLQAWPDGEPRVLTEEWDRSPTDLAWSDDGTTLVVAADHLGQRALFTIDAASGAVRPLVELGHVSGFTVAGDQVFYLLDHLGAPAELHRIGLDGSAPAQLTEVNRPLLAAAATGEYEQFQFTGWNDDPVYAYVVKPTDFDPDEKYPVAFIIHGGPQGSMGNNFHYRWNPQVYAGAGYAVLFVDFHGSTGYGQAFTDAISEHWGDRPLEDLDQGIAAALERYPWLDGDRMAALGASFGGYMINWVAGMWPGRFRCLVNHDGDLNERMAYFDTEELWFPEWEHGGTPWENPEGYERFDPMKLVDRWQTPMLVVHGANDFRVAETQGLATFTALQRRGIASRLLYFPDENHWVLKPANSVQWHETVLAWLERWTSDT